MGTVQITGKPIPIKKKALKKALLAFVESRGYFMENLLVEFVTDEDLLTINQKHLNHDYFTDIISFNYSSEKHLSGELFISIDRVKENAKTFNVSLSDEMLRVIAHGVLHLMGYQDKTKTEKRTMRKEEDSALSFLKKKLFHVEQNKSGS